MAAVSEGVTASLQELLALRAQGIGLSIAPGGKIGSPLSGSYVSRFRGRGMDFEEVREYQAGDDIRSMDWRVTARTNRPHTKVYHEERERPVLLVVDAGASMRFGTRNVFKTVAAARVAALFAWAALENGDRLGVLSLAGGAHRELRPCRGKRGLLRSLGLLADATERELSGDTGITDFSQALPRMRRLAKHGCLVVVISDFAGLDASQEGQLGVLARHNELVGVHIHDPLEAQLPPPGRYLFSDGAQVEEIGTGGGDLRQRFQDNFAERLIHLEDLFRRQHAHWLEISTADDPAGRLQQSFQAVRHRSYSRRRAADAGAL